MATDELGNASQPSAEVTFQVDQTKPAAPELDAPDSPTNQTLVQLTGHADSGSTVTLLEGNETVGSTTADAQGDFAYTVHALVDGTHTFHATATDAAGNVSDLSNHVTVTVDTVAPAVSVSLDKQQYATTDAVQIAYSVSDEDDNLTIDIETTPTYSIDEDNEIQPPLQAGLLQVKVTASDRAGNQGTATAVATVEALRAKLSVAPDLFEVQIPDKPKKPKNKDQDKKPVALTAYLSMDNVPPSSIDGGSLRLNGVLTALVTVEHGDTLEANFELDVAFVAALLSLPSPDVIEKLSSNANGVSVTLNTPVEMEALALGELKVTGEAMINGTPVTFESEDASRHINLDAQQAPSVTETFLAQNYPNPFNPETWIPYALVSESDVTIRIFNMQGVLIRRLDLGHQDAGFYLERDEAAHWDGRNDAGERVATGIYFYTISAGEFTASRRMLIVK